MVNARQQILLEIKSVASDGRGLGRFENKVVFVPYTVPGQKVLVTITSVHPKFLEGEVDKIITPSEYERVPLCIHAAQCGGCTWQHIQYNQQIVWKQQIVKDSLERIGKVNSPRVLDIIPSPNEWRYRNKMVFAFAFSNCFNTLLLGLKRADSHEIIPVTDCLLQSKNVMKILEVVRSWVNNEQQSFKESLDKLGYFRFLVIRETIVGDILVELIVHKKEKLGRNNFDEQALGKRLAQCLQQVVTTIKGVVLSRRTQSSDVAYSEYIIWSEGEVFLREQLEHIKLSMGNTSFFQVNTQGAGILYSEILSMAQLTGKEIVWDLYTGVGSIALFLAPFSLKTIGVESNVSSINLAKKNCFSLRYNNCSFIQSDTYNFICFQIQKGISPDVVIVDPPRVGLDKKVVELLIHLAPRRCIYVSCNPGTFARDVAKLTPYFILKQTRPIDLFPHTPHIEIVSELLYNSEYINCAS